MKKLFWIVLVMITLIVGVSYACFDTFLFLKGSSMVYPQRTLAIETLGEYSFNSAKDGSSDTYLADFNIYYGVFERFSLQVGLGSDEKKRNEFKFDSFKARGAYNITRSPKKGYFLDGILECVGNRSMNEINFELSFPSIFSRRNYLYVVHPVVNFTKGEGFAVEAGWHCGAFRLFENGSLIGLGAEFRSAQSGSYVTRLVEGEYACSIFYGAMIGKNLFIQNELAKGLSNSRDFGVALTLKFVLDQKK